MRRYFFVIIVLLLCTIQSYAQPLCSLFNTAFSFYSRQIPKDVTTEINFPPKPKIMDIYYKELDLAEGALRAYVSQLFKELTRVTGFRKYNLDDPTILFNENEDFGATIETPVDKRTGELFYLITFHLGVRSQRTTATIVSMIEFLDYLAINQFAHALFGNGSVNPHFSHGIKIRNKDLYSLYVPPTPQLGIAIDAQIEYGASLCALDKFSLAIGGARVEQSYRAFSRQIVHESLRKQSPDEFVILLNHIAVLAELGEHELADRVWGKTTKEFKNEPYFGELSRIVLLYRHYYRDTRIHLY